MRQILTAVLCLLMSICLLPSALAADDGFLVIEEPLTGDDTLPAGVNGFPPLNAQGFLNTGEYILEDPENGVWRYVSPTLKIEILRCQTEKPNRIWYEAEVWTNGDVWHMPTLQDGKHYGKSDWPYLVARKNGCVLALNTDFFQTRYSRHDIKVGVIIRDGQIYSDKTLAPKGHLFPNLDTLALFPDGDMRVFRTKEHTAQEYLDMGARDVLAFGPWLIRDGKINDDLPGYGKSNAPRTAIGMVENGHYFAMMLEGRHKGSVGGTVSFLAERMLEHGCTQAFNLDGGQTACILFMGKQICKVGGANNAGGNARRTSELLAIGTSDAARGD